MIQISDFIYKTFGHMNGIRNHHLSDFIILIGTL